MYQLMRESLQKSVGDVDLVVRLRHAAAAGLRKLEHYYMFARQNHFNILATGLSMFTLFNNADDSSSTVCHPALRVQWFAFVLPDMQTTAKELLGFYLDQYKSSAPQAPTLTPDNQPAGEDDFLASLVRRASASSVTQAVVAEPLSEIEHYAQLNHGMHDNDALKNPLLWWKVSLILMTL
jgi:hypothetical protein